LDLGFGWQFTGIGLQAMIGLNFMKRFAFFRLAAVLCLPLSATAQPYDFILRNGRVIDGTGNPAFFADVAVKDGRVAAIGRKLSGGAAQEFDAGGQIVAPGFIDVHTHAENIESLPEAENFLRMGVTTLVLGNCGSSRLGIGAYFSKLDEMGVSPNVSTLIGHGSVRSQVLGRSIRRPPTSEELEEMKGLVEQAMKEGALGMATGLIYLPGTFADTEEIVELARVVSAYGGIYVSHMRNEGRAIFSALDELFRIAREADIRAQISHIKLSGNIAWGQADKVLAAIDEQRALGLDITQDQYMYAASSTGISQLVPASAREGGPDAFKERIANPEEKARIIADMKQGLQATGRDSYAYAVIASYRADPSLQAKNIAEAARQRFGSDSLDAQIEMILEIQSKGGASGVFHGMNEDDLQDFLRHPNTMIASDSSVRRFEAGVPHPRGYGNNARALARYVRELEILRLEEAVRRMTTLPATVFGIKDRGQLREGAWADLVVFDPATVQDPATFNEPHQYATGFQYVFVNGVLVVENDEHNGARPGKMVRRGM
jgi:N-acyl-D-amino-acid deacylase